MKPARKKLYYIFNIRFPNEFAHSRQVVEMCLAFQQSGINTTLIIPQRSEVKHISQKKAMKYYGLKPNSFTIHNIFSLDLPWLPSKIRFSLHTISFMISSFITIFQHRPQMVFTRSWEILPIIALVKKIYPLKSIYEVHSLPAKSYERLTLKYYVKHVDCCIALSKALKKYYQKWTTTKQKFLFIENGVDLNRYQVTSYKTKLRRQFNLPSNKVLIGYIGRLTSMGQEKGIQILLPALQRLVVKNAQVKLLIIGGPNEQIKQYRQYLSKHNLTNFVMFLGQVSYSQIPSYLKTMDILILPQTRFKHFAHYTSPLKLFEYMAAKKPIVATKVPSIIQILDSNSAILVEPDDPKALAKGISWTLEHPKSAKKKADQAYKDAQHYTWESRIKKILFHL